MSQNSIVIPNTGTLSGVTLVNDANAAMDSLATMFAGPSAPSSPQVGQHWLDTTNNLLKIYLAGAWSTLARTSGGVAAPTATFGRLAKSVAGGSSVTLDPNTEATCVIQEFSGALTANINVLCPTLAGLFLVKNNTTGASSLTYKTASGTGVAVPQGFVQLLWCDGTNIVAITPPYGATQNVAVQGQLATNSSLLVQGTIVGNGAQTLAGTMTIAGTSAGFFALRVMSAAGFSVYQPNYNGEICYTNFSNDTMAGGQNTAAAVLYMVRSNGTGRSLNAAGSINASGADYAEYERRHVTCGLLFKGDIVGRRADGLLTDKWSEAVTFGVKSTNPGWVGGDDWHDGVMPPAVPIALRPLPDNAAEEMVIAHQAASLAYEARYAQFEIDKAAWEAAQNETRLWVDRIAKCGRVPCNVKGASAGDWILPAEGAEGGIIGIAVPDSAISFDQYRQRIGFVRRILDDGRAEIEV